VDLTIRAATIVDGTNTPRRRGDVVVRNGRIHSIAETGKGEASRHTIDADGLVLTPGFVDIHTHYDAQLMFEPTASPASWHGVTTVVIGNCGFSLAPCEPADVPWILHSLARVEGMSPESLFAGVTFGGGSMRNFLDHVRSRIGVNVVTLAGHSAIRRKVMGRAGSERAASSDEIALMQAELHRAMREGAMGFSTSQLDVHADHEGLPVPSNVATPEEIVALAAVIAAYPGATMEFAPHSSLPGYSEADRQLLFDMARVSKAPLNVNMIDWFPGFDDGWQRNLSVAEQAHVDGLRIYPMFRANPQDFYFSFDDTFIFDDVPAIRDALVMAPGPRAAALRDPARREAMNREFHSVRRSVTFQFHQVCVAATGQPVRDLDHALDLALAEDLRTVFRINRQQGEAHRAFRHDIVQHPLLTAGASDGGAHLQTFCGADYPTVVLRDLVPSPFTLEQAVYRLAAQPAAMLSLHDRGTIEVGKAADLVLFDHATVDVAYTGFLADLPAGARRLVHRPKGYHAVIVNGTPIYRDGEATGDLPGEVLTLA